MNSDLLANATVGTVAIGERRVRRFGQGCGSLGAVVDRDRVRDRAEAIRLCHQMRDRGVELFDTANVYGFGRSEEILGEAFGSDESVVVATKAGFRPGKLPPGAVTLPPCGIPEHIVEECDKSLVRLRRERIDLYHLHSPDPKVPLAETLGAFAGLQRAGKIGRIGISNVTVAELAEARSIVDVVTVQSPFSPGRRNDRLLAACEAAGVVFIAHSPANSAGTETASVVAEIAEERGVSAFRVGIAWLLGRSPLLLPIPGALCVDHALDNLESAWLVLTDAERARIDSAGHEADSAYPRE